MASASTEPLTVLSTGMVSSVGLSAASSCAAVRAGLANPTELRVLNSKGEWQLGHKVPLAPELTGVGRLAHLARMSIEECLSEVPRGEWSGIPLLLCVAEHTRPGRVLMSDEEILARATSMPGATFARQSRVIAQGRVAVAVALQYARELLQTRTAVKALIVATDSLLHAETLRAFDGQGRLLTTSNSNGFLPGEAAAAILIGRADGAADLAVEGLGFGVEPAPLGSERPLRADGLTRAIEQACAEAHCEMFDLDFRITDLAGEQYYFKEAALALSRKLRRRKEEFALWHPSECIGEVGAAIGPVLIAVAAGAFRGAYAAGPRALVHIGNDSGERSAVILRNTA